MYRIIILIITCSLMYSCADKSSRSAIVAQVENRLSGIETECEKFEILDEEMRRVLDEIREKYKSDRSFILKLNSSQAYWIPYMNSHVRALFPKDWDRHYRKKYGRTEFNECKCEALSKLIMNRINDLVIFLETDGQTGDCPNITVE